MAAICWHFDSSNVAFANGKHTEIYMRIYVCVSVHK